MKNIYFIRKKSLKELTNTIPSLINIRVEPKGKLRICKGEFSWESTKSELQAKLTNTAA